MLTSSIASGIQLEENIIAEQVKEGMKGTAHCLYDTQVLKH
jgi:hypothetical protein